MLETEHRKHLELAEAEKGRLRVQSTNGDERVRSLQQRLDASATQARALQTEVQRAKLDLGAEQTKHELHSEKMHEKIGKIEERAEKTARQFDETQKRRGDQDEWAASQLDSYQKRRRSLSCDLVAASDS